MTNCAALGLFYSPATVTTQNMKFTMFPLKAADY